MWAEPRVRRRAGLALASLLALAVCLYRIRVPDPWADEGATVVAVQRTWSGLLVLWNGQDAVHLPDYLLIKAVASLFPGVPTLLLARTISAVLAAGTVACVYSLVVRRLGIAAALLSSFFLISLPGFVRYGQDARPYALVMFTSAASWLAWSTWRRPDGTAWLRSASGWWRELRAGAAYVVSLAGSVVTSLFGAFGWPAQVLAELTTPGIDRETRLRRAANAAVLMVIAFLLVSVHVVRAALLGRGPSQTVVPFTARTLGGAWLQLLTVARSPAASALLLGLSALAVVLVLVPAKSWQEGLEPARDLVRIAVIWFAVPMALNVVAAAVRFPLLRARYWVSVLAPLAVLAGIGGWLIARAVFRLAGRAASRWGLRPSGAVPAAVAAVVAAGLLATQVAVMAPLQLDIRRRDGHGRSLYPAIRVLEGMRAAEPSVPILAFPGSTAAMLIAVRPQLADTNLLFVAGNTSAWVWPTVQPAEKVQRQLAGLDRVFLLQQVRSGPARAEPYQPEALAGSGFEITGRRRAGDFWVLILQR